MRRRTVGGPRSNRTRNNIAMRATGWTPSEVCMQILKGLYSDTGSRPAYAELAYRRHWITSAAYLQIPADVGPSRFDLLYEPSPLFQLVKR